MGPATRAARHAAWALGVAAGYYVGGVVGTVLSVPPYGFAILWPATAFLIGVLMIAPPRAAWFYLAAAIPAHFQLTSQFQQADMSLAVLLSQVGGNIGLAGATALALRAVGAAPLRLDNFRMVLRFIVIGGLAVPALGNALILGLHIMTGWTDAFWLSWRQWMLASVMPTLTIPPVLILAFDRGAGAAAAGRRTAGLELSILCAALFALSFAAFGWGLESAWWPELALVSLPLMLWVAVRFGVGETSLALLVFAAAIIVRALDGQGPFALRASLESVVSLQVFLTGLSIPLLLLSALTGERRRTEEVLRRSAARIQLVAAATETGLWQWDPAARRLWVTDFCREMLGLGPGTTITPAAFLNLVHVDDRATVRAALNATLGGDLEAMAEFRVVRPNGERRWLAMRSNTQFNAAGDPVSINGVFRDITERVKAQREVENLGQRLLVLQEEERQKIAEEMHELTAQNLTAVSLNLSALQRRLALKKETGSSVDEAFAALNQARTELRTFTYLLRPAGLDREGLCAVLHRHVDGFSLWTGLKATLRSSPDADRLPLEQQRTVLRIVQESLMNVHRHAAATRVSVRMRRVRDNMHLVIRDDGAGIAQPPEPDGGPAPRAGVGIRGMTARVRQLSGRMAIRSSAKGTVVHAAIPMAYAGPETPTSGG